MLFARAMRARYPGIDMEVWRPEVSLKENEYIWRDEDQIVHRVYPSRYVRFNLEYSPKLLSAVKAVADNRQVQIWVHGIYNLHAYLMAKPLSRSQAIFQSHGGLPAKKMWSISRHRWLKSIFLLLHQVEKRALSRCPHIYAISTQEKRYLEQLYFPAAKDRVSFSPVGVDFCQFSSGSKEDARTRCGLDDQRVVLYVGRLAYDKGVDFLISSFAKIARRYSTAHLYIAGSGPLCASLQEQVDAHGIGKRVHFLGYVARGDLCYWYRAAEVTVMPSLHEWFGMVAAESMACGTPVIATKAGGAIDIVEAFECGVLVPPQDIASLENALDLVLTEKINLSPNVERGRLAFDWSVKFDHSFALGS